MYFDHHYPVTELTNMDNNDDQKDTKLRRERTQDAGILKIMEDQTTEYVCKKQRLVNNDSAKIMDNINL